MADAGGLPNLPPAEEHNAAQIYRNSSKVGQLHQGEILSNILQSKLNTASLEAGGELAFDVIEHPFAVVFSQECDLEQDYKQRAAGTGGNLPAVLLCEIITAEELRGHRGIDSSIWKLIRQNNHERYQYLQQVQPEHDLDTVGLPDLAMDFKRYFTIPTEEIYFRLQNDTHRRCVLVSPFLEHLSARFFNFQARVALPSEHFRPPIAEAAARR